MEEKKEIWGTRYERVAAGAHLPTPWRFALVLVVKLE